MEARVPMPTLFPSRTSEQNIFCKVNTTSIRFGSSMLISNIYFKCECSQSDFHKFAFIAWLWSSFVHSSKSFAVLMPCRAYVYVASPLLPFRIGHRDCGHTAFQSAPIKWKYTPSAAAAAATAVAYSLRFLASIVAFNSVVAAGFLFIDSNYLLQEILWIYRRIFLFRLRKQWMTEK